MMSSLGGGALSDDVVSDGRCTVDRDAVLRSVSLNRFFSVI